jgi:hypothetical protein
MDEVDFKTCEKVAFFSVTDVSFINGANFFKLNGKKLFD